MTPPTDKVRSEADERAFLGAYARAREAFSRIDGVIGVSYGLKQTGGTFTDDLAIVVLVKEKKDEAGLPPGDRIPPTFEGYRTDVRVPPRVVPGVCDNEQTYDTIQGGIQIVAKGIQTDPTTMFFEKGTLGCIVRKRNDAGRENVYLLSNKHVLHRQHAGVNDDIYHPIGPGVGLGYTTLGPVQPGGVYGNQPFVVNQGDPPEQFFLDCAIARVDIDSKCGGSTCTKDTTKYDTTIVDLQVNGVNTMADVRSVIGQTTFVGATVFKVGRTTGKTQGRVVSVNLEFPCAGDPSIAGSAVFQAFNGLEIAFQPTTANPTNCKGHTWFGEKGDSGSIVVDEQNRVVGLLSQVPNPATATPTETAIACHIVPVLDLLRICVPCTTGTSHGTTNATDGSGILPALMTAPDSQPGDFPMPDGEIVFASAGAGLGRAAARRAPPPPVIDLSDGEVRRMHGLLAALRTTKRGRELHDVFADVRRELGYLVRNCRPVTVAWHRHKGPAFFAHVLNHLAGNTDSIPHEVQGVTRRALLVRMGEVLTAHGSNPLREAIATYGDELLAMATNGACNTAEDCIAFLQEREPA